VLAAMLAIFIPLAMLCAWQEQTGTPQLRSAGASLAADASQPGGNMEGKELRFGIAPSALWATATTAASNGSVNSMHDSYTPLGGIVPLTMMMFSEVVFGGVGSGLYGMLAYAIVAVFIAGADGRSNAGVLGQENRVLRDEDGFPARPNSPHPGCCWVLQPAWHSPQDERASPNPGVHGFSEVLYNYASGGNNNGKRLRRNVMQRSVLQPDFCISMFISRYWMIIPVLAIAGSLARKKYIPAAQVRSRTHTPLFNRTARCCSHLVGVLNFVPALALGPIAEHLQMYAAGGAGRLICDTSRKLSPRGTAAAQARTAGLAAQLNPRHQARKPGDVRRAGRQPGVHGAGGDGDARSRRGATALHPQHHVLAVVHAVVRQFRRGAGRGPWQGASGRSAQCAPRRSGEEAGGR